MRRFTRFLKKLYRSNRCHEEEKQRQEDEGYRVEFKQAGPERFITYIECGREANVIAEFSFLNDVVLFTDSFRIWSKPSGEELSEFDFLRVRNRLIRYFSCWGDVTVDDRVLPAPIDPRIQLEADGIPYKEMGDDVIMYEVDVEEERKRKGGFFNR